MRIRRDVEYALIDLSVVSRSNGTVSARVLSESQRIPYKLLGRILQQLTHAGILSSVQGPKGGYAMGKHPREITLGDVMESVQGPERVVPCIENDTGCGRENDCSIRSGILRVQDIWSGMMRSLTLEDFLRRGGDNNAASA